MAAIGQPLPQACRSLRDRIRRCYAHIGKAKLQRLGLQPGNQPSVLSQSTTIAATRVSVSPQNSQCGVPGNS